MGRQLTDAEMDALEAQEAAKAPAAAPKLALTDEEMDALEAQEASQAPLSDMDRKKADVRKILTDIKSPENRKNITGAMTNAASMMTGGMAKALPEMGAGIASKAAKMLAPPVESGLVGAAQDENNRLRGFLMGAGTTAAANTAGAILRKAGDVGMQMAVGRKKYTPGVGTELADQGLIGTRGMMRDQTQRGLTDNYETMYRQASEIPKIDVRKIGNEIRDEMKNPLTGDGTLQARTRDVSDIAAIDDFADDIAQHGTETGVQALKRRRAAGASGYNPKSQDPKVSLPGRLSKLEQQKYSQALKEADPSGKLAVADKSYGALKRAEKALAEEASLNGLGGVLFGGMGRYGGALPLSAGSQAAIKTATGLEDFLAPMLRQAVVNRSEKKKDGK